MVLAGRNSPVTTLHIAIPQHYAIDLTADYMRQGTVLDSTKMWLRLVILAAFACEICERTSANLLRAMAIYHDRITAREPTRNREPTAEA
jgi:hypothetical protein